MILCCLYKISSGQINEKNKSHAHFRYHNTIVSINNSFIEAPARKYVGGNIQFPFKGESLLITGAELKISITELNKEDSILGYSSFLELEDTTVADSNLFRLNNLQARIIKNNIVINEWNSTLVYPSFLDSFISQKDKPGNLKKSYWIFNDSIQAGDSILIEFRNKDNLKALSKYTIKRLELPVMPFLAMMWQDSSSTKSTASFIQTAIIKRDKIIAGINSFYAGWPPKIGAGHRGERYFPTSKLAFYFAKQNTILNDSSLEYKLTGGEYIDTSWRKSGHLILVPEMQSNSNYVLLVRYINYPDNVWETTFYVPPNWYQTNTFKMLTGFAIALLLMLAIVLLYLEKLKKEREKKERLNLELRSIRSQLNPHFVFNALGSIQGLINTNEIDKANQYLSEFSNLLRDSLKSSNEDFVPLADEIQIIESYTKLEQLRFGFNYEITVSENMNVSEIQIPSLLIQPLIENAIKHGVAGMGNKGKLSIDFSKNATSMFIGINDNGKGFETSETLGGFGLKLTGERIRLLNQVNKEQLIIMDIKSKLNQGTTVTLLFRNHLL